MKVVGFDNGGVDGGVERAAAVGIIDRMVEEAGQFSALAKEQAIRRKTIVHMQRTVEKAAWHLDGKDAEVCQRE